MGFHLFRSHVRAMRRSDVIALGLLIAVLILLAWTWHWGEPRRAFESMRNLAIAGEIDASSIDRTRLRQSAERMLAAQGKSMESVADGAMALTSDAALIGFLSGFKRMENAQRESDSSIEWAVGRSEDGRAFAIVKRLDTGKLLPFVLILERRSGTYEPGWMLVGISATLPKRRQLLPFMGG